jgi:mono/diheme cytochrome c family protein
LKNNRLYLSSALLLAFATVACRQDMHNQPRYKPLSVSEFFPDHRSERPQLEGTIARGHLRLDQARYSGRVGENDIDEFPIPIARADLARGQERFNIYCSPCHGRLGDGTGLVVLRGFRQPPSYYTERLKKIPVGHFFDVMTNGYGAMASYASRVGPDDRWRIAAYIRALQFSESASINDVPAEQRANLPVETPPWGVLPPVSTNEAPAHPALMMPTPVPMQDSGAAGPVGTMPMGGAPAIPSRSVNPEQGTPPIN